MSVPSAKVLVIFDATALHKDWTMSGSRWGQVWALSRRGFINVAVPQVVVMEASRQLVEHLHAQEKKLAGVAGEVESLITRLRDVGVHRLGPTISLDSEPPEQRQGVEEAISQRILEMRGEVLPLPTTAHREVVDRDLDRRKPFHPTGKGYRDALAWLSIVDRLAASPKGQRVVWVTDNSDDYLIGGGMAPNLLAEVPEHVQESGIAVLKDLASLLESAEVTILRESVVDSTDELSSEYNWAAASTTRSDELNGHAAMSQAAGRLAGSTVRLARRRDAAGLDFEAVDLDPDRELWDIAVDTVNTKSETARWSVYDVHADQTLLVEAEIEADLTLIGHMDAEYFYFGSPAGYQLVEDLPGGRVVAVRTERSVVLHFKAIADRTKRSVQSVQFEYATEVGDDQAE